MADLDLLVQAPALDEAVALLAELGYEEVFRGRKHVKLAPRGGREIVARGGEDAGNPRWVELHPACGEWLGDERIDLTAPMWAAAREERLLGEPAWVPAAPAHWLYLLVHATHHILINRFRLVQLLDLLLLEPELPHGGVVAAETADGAGAMARALYPPLALLVRYAAAMTAPAAPASAAPAAPVVAGPGALAAAPADRAADGPRAALTAALRPRLSRGFLEWADGLDLFHCCYLDAAPWRAE
jgi:hypothetical protein